MRYTSAPARQAELLRRITEGGYVSSAQSAEEFGVSEMTIRRDLLRLEESGQARRVTGGATTTGIPFEERDRAAADAKGRLARGCGALFKDVSTVLLDAGTTVAAVAPQLPAGVTVISHSVPVINSCASRTDVDLIAIGGNFRRDTRSFTGSIAREGYAQVQADLALLSATAVNEHGILCANTLDAELKLAMAASSHQVALIVDASKLSARAPIRVGDLELVDILLTNDGADESVLEACRSAGIHVILVPNEAPAARSMEDPR